MTDFRDGEIVDIVIKGADVQWESLDTLYVVVGGIEIEIPYKECGISVTRVAPAEWPPQPGDLWRDPTGVTWYLVEWDLSGTSPRLVTFGSRSETRIPSALGGVGWTLVHREQQDGGQPDA